MEGLTIIYDSIKNCHVLKRTGVNYAPWLTTHRTRKLTTLYTLEIYDMESNTGCIFLKYKHLSTRAIIYKTGSVLH